MAAYDLIVIGAGSGGVRAARVAAAHGAKVAIAEEHKIGGTCVIRGCVPKKLLVYGAHFAEDLNDAAMFGWDISSCQFNWPVLRDNVLAEVGRLEAAYTDTLTNHGVEILHGRAVMTGPTTVRIADKDYTASTILIATGAQPVMPDLPGIEHAISSNEVFHLNDLPKRVVIAGGGYIANEFAGIFHQFGSHVTIVNRSDAILRGYDEQLRDRLLQISLAKGIDFRFNALFKTIERREDGSLELAMEGCDDLEADEVLFAVGRRPNVEGLGCEAAGVELGENGEIKVDADNRTSAKSVYAVGDVTDRVQLTPVAIREGQAFADTVFGGKPTRVDYRSIPSAVFSHPPLAGVGLTESQARNQLGSVRTYTSDFRPMKNVLAGRNERSLYKLVVDASTEEVVGVHMIGPDAPELLQVAAIAVKARLKKEDFDATVALHPTMAEEFGADALMPDAVIIGGGHNGLTCAYYLAKKGMKVTILEAADKVGGAAVTDEFAPGFRNSAASYTVSLLQPKVIRDMELERHGLKVVLRKIDNFLPGEGRDYLLAGQGGLTRAELARHVAADGAAYDRYNAELETVVRLVKKWILKAPPGAGAGVRGLPALAALGKDLIGLSTAQVRTVHEFATKSAGDILDRFFEGDLGKALFAFDGIVGNFASPYTPGTAYVLLHHLFGEAAGVPGAWGHAIGGMGAITQAMAKACREAGVDIVLNSPVSEVIVEKGRAVGVAAGGKAWRAPVIVANVNPKLLFDRLIPEGAVTRQVEEHFHHWGCESATFRMNVALDKLPSFTAKPGRGNHLTAGIIIAPSMDYMHRAFAEAALNGWTKNPVVEMLIPSTLDSTLAPKGKHVASLFCQHFRYTLPDGRRWDDEREAAADAIIATVDKVAPGFASSVIARQIHSPLDLERRFGLIGGDIFHGKMGSDQLFSARPMIGHADYRMPLAGLYLCGSGAHPGGGVSGAPGHNAAKAILADRKALFPFGRPRKVA